MVGLVWLSDGGMILDPLDKIQKMYPSLTVPYSNVPTNGTRTNPAFHNYVLGLKATAVCFLALRYSIAHTLPIYRRLIGSVRLNRRRQPRGLLSTLSKRSSSDGGHDVTRSWNNTLMDTAICVVAECILLGHISLRRLASQERFIDFGLAVSSSTYFATYPSHLVFLSNTTG